MTKAKKAHGARKPPNVELPLKKRRAIAEALAFTELPMKEIAKRFNVSVHAVERVNKRCGIRSPEEIKQIAKKYRKTKKTSRKKICFFSAEEKLQLLKQHRRGILKIVNATWQKHKKLLLTEFMSFGDLLNRVNQFIFEQLDYYNPKAKGKNGKQVKPFTYMMGGARLSCHRIVSNLLKREGSWKAMIGIEQAESKKTMKPIELAIPHNRRVEIELATISRSTTVFLHKLGLDPRGVAGVGFQRVKQAILKTSRKTNLSAREYRVIKGRLEGLTLEQIGQGLSLTRERVRQIEFQAIEKIKAELKKTLIKLISDSIT